MSRYSAAISSSDRSRNRAAASRSRRSFSPSATRSSMAAAAVSTVSTTTPADRSGGRRRAVRDDTYPLRVELVKAGDEVARGLRREDHRACGGDDSAELLTVAIHEGGRIGGGRERQFREEAAHAGGRIHLR